MSVGGSLAHDRAAQVEVTDDATRSEVKVLLDDFGQLSVGHAFLDSSVRINKDGKRVRHTNGVRQLNQCALAKLGSDQTLGDPASSISSRSVDLRGVLSGKGASSMSTPSSVCINDDFTSSQTGISVWSTNNKATRGVQVVNGLVVKVLFWDNRLDDVLHQVSLDLLLGDILRVLGGDDNGVHALGHWDSINEVVLAGDLGLSIRSHPVTGSVLSDLGELGSQLRGEDVRKRHELRGLVSGVSEHDSLISSANILGLLGVDGLRNVGRLLLNGNDDVASLVVKALGWVIVANVLDGVADDLLVVDGGRGGDLSEDHDHARLAAGLASDAREFIAGNAGVEDGIGDLVAELV